MDIAIIEEENKNSVIEFKKHECRGCTFYQDGRIEPVSKDIFHLFKAFLLSSNKKKLPNEGVYQVYLDNKTGFKHYFLNNEEDFAMFFENNGEDEIVYALKDEDDLPSLEDNGWKRKILMPLKEKCFVIGKKIVHCTFKCLLHIMLFASILNATTIYMHPERVTGIRTIPIVEWVVGRQDLTTKSLMKRIYSSSNLPDDYKKYLANEDFFDDILPYVNSSNYVKFLYNRRFDNIQIKSYDNTNMNSSGYYNSGRPNSLFVAENCVNNDFDDVVSHEFIHLCQSNFKYRLIIEACAEIISSEYYDNAVVDAYIEEVYLVRKLMEIIGSEPILEYVFGNNFQKIESSIKPYLNSDEYQRFLDSLKRLGIDNANYQQEEINTKNASLDAILDLVYERKFGVTVDNDPVIPFLHDASLVRYYFNHRKTAKEGSYIIICEYNINYVSLEKALEDDLVSAYQLDDKKEERKVSLDEYLNKTYDTSKELYFATNKSFVNIIGEVDGEIRVVTNNIRQKRIALPTIIEKFQGLEEKNDGTKKI